MAKRVPNFMACTSPVFGDGQDKALPFGDGGRGRGQHLIPAKGHIGGCSIHGADRRTFRSPRAARIELPDRNAVMPGKGQHFAPPAIIGPPDDGQRRNPAFQLPPPAAQSLRLDVLPDGVTLP
jgi:hypothetical protein